MRQSLFARGLRVVLEMFLARVVDNFQTYVVDLVRAVLHAKPAMLSTRQQTLTLEELLSYDRIEDLVHDILERRINGLAYEGFIELQTWCAERGMEISVSQTDQVAVVEFFAIRNVIAHNRGVVDEKYVKATESKTFAIGTVRNVSVDDFFQAMSMFHRIVTETDRIAAEKFQLPKVLLRDCESLPDNPAKGDNQNVPGE